MPRSPTGATGLHAPRSALLACVLAGAVAACGDSPTEASNAPSLPRLGGAWNAALTDGVFVGPEASPAVCSVGELVFVLSQGFPSGPAVYREADLTGTHEAFDLRCHGSVAPLPPPFDQDSVMHVPGGGLEGRVSITCRSPTQFGDCEGGWSGTVVIVFHDVASPTQDGVRYQLRLTAEGPTSHRMEGDFTLWASAGGDMMSGRLIAVR